MIFERTTGLSLNSKNCSISYHELLKEYLQYDLKIKSEVHSLMQENPYYWKTVLTHL
jgi:hypothetical protein